MKRFFLEGLATLLGALSVLIVCIFAEGGLSLGSALAVLVPSVGGCYMAYAHSVYLGERAQRRARAAKRRRAAAVRAQRAASAANIASVQGKKPRIYAA